MLYISCIAYAIIVVYFVHINGYRLKSTDLRYCFQTQKLNLSIIAQLYLLQKYLTQIFIERQ